MKIVKKMLFILFILFLIGSTIFMGVGYFNYRNAIKDTSLKEKINEIRSKSTYVTFDEISQYLIDGTISIEDRRFYEHHGVDYFSLGRAVVGNIFANDIVGGGSTITQQLAKNLYFTYQPSYIRKMSEIFVAYDLEKELDKKEIIELYLNVINYGDNHIGIVEASKGYFQKDPVDLTLDESTLLAGLPQSPSNYQLSDNEKNARIRQEQVLEAMLRDGYMTQNEYNSMKPS